MNRQVAEELQTVLGISMEQVVREEYEMVILKKLLESEVGSSFVFKGGTALRLAYGCPRFSEDLDFSLISDFNRDICAQVLRTIERESPALTIKELVQKKNTFFALFQIQESFLVQNFSIKFEASLRVEDMAWKKGADFGPKVLSSKISSLTALGQVATLERIEKEKLSIEPKRIRDIFDLWFIGQRLGNDRQMDFRGFDLHTIKRELHKFLPQTERRILEPWLPQE